MNTNKPLSKLMALVLSIALVFTMIPFTVFAEVVGCNHEHDETCGYVEGAECGHEHDGNCAEDGAECDHTQHDEACGYIEAAPCGHVHDANCGGLSLGDSGAVIVAAFDELDEYTLYQGYDYGVIQSQDDLILPDTLTGTDADDNPITIEGVTWESEPAFDPAVSIAYPGYIFSPVLPEGYILAEGVAAPVIAAIIRPGDLLPNPLAASVNIGTNGVLTVDRTGTATGSRVYYGGTVWRVVSIGSGEVTLFKEGSVGNRIFDPSSNDWSTSEICAWLNGTGSFTTDGYLPTTFTARESAIIQNYGLSPENQKIVLPSEAEVQDGGTWGFTDNADRRANYPSNSWWLRTPGDTGYTKTVSNVSGAISNSYVNNNLIVVRPAFKLRTSDILFTSMPGSKNSVQTGRELSPAAAITGAVKLTVLDSGLALTGATLTSVAERTINFSYSGATAGSTLSAVVKSSTGALKYYGQLATNIGTSGTASVTVPEDFASGDTLSVFVEEVNSSTATDYASALLPITFTDNPTAPTGVGKVDCTSANNDGQITGVNNTMEYKLASASAWTAITGTQITGLAPGTYYVRYAANGTTLASPYVAVVIASYTWADSGNGTSGTPYIIKTEAQLRAFAAYVNAGNTFNSGGRYVKLGNDIALSSAEWTPIGYDISNNYLNFYFGGYFDGDGHSVTGMNINATIAPNQYAYLGLFGYTNGGYIKNLRVEGSINATITNSRYLYTGGLEGRRDTGQVENCSADVSICLEATSSAGVSGGGLIGYIADGTISGSFATGDVTVKSNSDVARAGGLVGYAYTSSINISISNCYATGNVNAGSSSGSTYAGGFAALINNRTISNCYATGETSATSGGTKYAGGFAGDVTSGGTLSNCSFIGTGSGVGNGTATATGLTMAQMTDDNALTTMSLSTSDWSKRAASGNYVYRPELTAFYNAIPSTTQQLASEASARVLAAVIEAPVITSADSATFTVGTSGSFTVTATNSPTSFAIGGDTLPSGVTFNTATGVLSGTPASGTAATYHLTFTATNAGGTSSPQSFTLTVAAALTDITAAAVSITAPVTGATPQGTITAGTGYTGTISWSGSPASFVSSTVYTATVTLTSTAGYQFAATVPAASITGTNGTVGTPSTSGTGTGNTLTFTVTYPQTAALVPTITSASSTTFTEGTSGSFTVTATNSPTSFAIGGDTLPSGVTFNTTTGVLSGTPASGTAATYNLTFTATNAGGTSSPQTFTLTVVAPTIYTITFNANGGSVSPTSMQTGADGKLASLPMPTRSGSYSFNGWYTASSGGTQITTSYVFTANTTIYAQWTYTGGGGGGGSSSPSYNITTDKQPNMPKVSTMTYAGTVQNNCLTCTITKSMIQAAVNKAGTDPDGIALAFVITNGGSYHCQTISIAGDALDLLKSSGVNYVLVQTDIFRFQFDSAAISSLDSQTAGTVAVSADPVSMLSGAASAAIGNRPAFGFTVKDSAGKTVTSYGSGTVTRGIKYTAVSTEKTGSLFIVKIVDGKVQWIDKSSYDNGWILWSGDSNAVYGVGYKTPAPAFTDTANHWAKDDIDFVASHDLISGTSATTFFPDTAITRATFLMALGKLSGADVSGYTASSFTDVPDTNPAMPYIEWAVKNNIVQGIGDNKFGPDSLITREQMAVMMMGYAKATGYTLPVSQQATTFADDAKISSWAKEAVKAIQQTGVISGKPNNLFDPQGSATRAEAATILRRFVELVIDEGAARGWVQNDAGQWQYINTYGNAVTGWLNTEANKYWFDDKGIMAADKWVQISGKWYYFYADGKLAVNVTIDGYTVGADGARKE